MKFLLVTLSLLSFQLFASGNGVERSELPKEIVEQIKAELSSKCAGFNAETFSVEKSAVEKIDGDQYEYDINYTVRLSDNKSFAEVVATDFFMSDLSYAGVRVAIGTNNLSCNN